MKKNTFECWSYHAARWIVNETTWKTVPKPPKSVFWKPNRRNRVFGFWIMRSVRYPKFSSDSAHPYVKPVHVLCMPNLLNQFWHAVSYCGYGVSIFWTIIVNCSNVYSVVDFKTASTSPSPFFVAELTNVSHTVHLHVATDQFLTIHYMFCVMLYILYHGDVCILAKNNTYIGESVVTSQM